jgi:hypothetical protein
MIIITVIKMPRNPAENIHGVVCSLSGSHSLQCAGCWGSLQTHIYTPTVRAMAQKKPAAVLFHGTLLPVQNFGP